MAAQLEQEASSKAADHRICVAENFVRWSLGSLPCPPTAVSLFIISRGQRKVGDGDGNSFAGPEDDDSATTEQWTLTWGRPFRPQSADLYPEGPQDMLRGLRGGAGELKVEPDELLVALLTAEGHLIAALASDGVLGANWEQVCRGRRCRYVRGSNRAVADIDGKGCNGGYYAKLVDNGEDTGMNDSMEECWNDENIDLVKGSLGAQVDARQEERCNWTSARGAGKRRVGKGSDRENSDPTGGDPTSRGTSDANSNFRYFREERWTSAQ